MKLRRKMRDWNDWFSMKTFKRDWNLNQFECIANEFELVWMYWQWVWISLNVITMSLKQFEFDENEFELVWNEYNEFTFRAT